MAGPKTAPGVWTCKQTHTAQTDITQEIVGFACTWHSKGPNTAKWRTVRHLIDPEPDAPFNQKHVDMEGASGLETPRALDGQNIFDHSVSHEPNVGQSSAAMNDVDEEQKQSRDAADVVIVNETFHDTYGDVYEDDGNERDVTEIVGDFDNDDNVDAMAMALTSSGVNTKHAQQVAF